MTGAVAERFRRIAWIDVAIQLVVGGGLIALLWAFAVSGLFQRGVVSFSEWYASDVTPIFAVGSTAVLTGTDFSEGVFGIDPTAPATLSSTVIAAAS
ncbi:hypothetical protein [Demequina lignilytica]|uniref:Uncharacterized protein n=1 Tax=Demequina lignilytica TaxID=3051663 RepID=A0AB35MJ72_9MICO|nr:hypothetical protein [Demequina sp. SYSU T0a273]MDN4483797.1 hypothetical protein [Demequina sp. SYSU T0a273]